MKKRKSMIVQNKDDEFERDFENTDFGSDNTSADGVLIRASERRGRPRVGKKFNVVMPEELILKIQEAGKRRGVGYQTMVRMICSERITEYLNK